MRIALLALLTAGCSLALELEAPARSGADAAADGAAGEQDGARDGAADGARDGARPARDAAPAHDAAPRTDAAAADLGPDAVPPLDDFGVRLDARPNGCTDEDGDGFGLGCSLGDDCDDADEAVNPDAVERCNGHDDDCDGAIDEAPQDVGAPCTVGVGECLRAGDTVCRGGAPVCDAVPGEPAVETCNGLDDNCNGAVDEPYPALGMPCAVGVGGCRREGVRVCDAGGARLACSAVAGAPEPEICDEVDDDCDGAVDEDTPTCDGRPCVDIRSDQDHCGRCGRACGAGAACVEGECRPVTLFSGIQTRFPDEDIVGWRVCHTSTYGESGIPLEAILAECAGDGLMYGCRRTGQPTWQLLAMGFTEEVLQPTPAEQVHRHNEVFWYYRRDQAMGFSPRQEVDLEPCDTSPGAADRRLCWRLADGQLFAGGRCGFDQDLNGGAFERRLWTR